MQKPPEFYHPAPLQQKFCSQCGHALVRMTPPMDNRERDCCTNCGAVLYRNPLIVAGTVPTYEDKILLCQRAISPRYGKWTLPAGFMELGESTRAGAERETLEEAGALIQSGDLFTVIDVPDVNQVHIYYLARVLSPKLNPGEESLQAAFFAFDEIPWDEIAFTTVSSTLKHFIADYAKHSFGTHFYTLDSSHRHGCSSCHSSPSS